MAKRKTLIAVIICVAALAFNGDSLFPYISEDTDSSVLAEFIPKKDRKRLEYFFRRLIFWDDGGYVLVGNKPCSIALFQDPTHFDSHFLSSLTPSNLRFWLGWTTWKKYEGYFPHPRFSFLKENLKNGTSLIIFINKQEFLNTISSNQADFEIALQNRIDPTQILDEAKSNPLFSGVLKNNDFLIGMLLGFGRNNSWRYYLNHQTTDKLPTLNSFVDSDEHQRFANYISSHNSWAFTSGKLFQNLSEIPLPGFSVDPNTIETSCLKKKYVANRQKIIEQFAQKNFLDTTLQLLLTRAPNILRPFKKCESVKEAP